MGLLKRLGKAVKRVVKGVGKVFKKITSFVGRAMQSKWGKALMVAATVFSMGAAAGLWGGFGAAGAAAGTTASNAGGFFSKFVAGAKNFFGVGGGQAAAGSGSAMADAIAAASGTALAPAAGGSAIANAIAAAGGKTAAGGMLGGVMRKAGTAALDFLKTPGGATIAGSAIKGFAEGKQQEEMLAEEERQRRYYDNAWRDPAATNALADQASREIQMPGGFMERARRVTAFLDARSNPSAAPMTPAQVAQLAVGG